MCVMMCMYVCDGVQFPKWMLADEDLVDLCVLESDTHLEGIKRFSDFNKFHDLLLSSPLSVHIKGEAFIPHFMGGVNGMWVWTSVVAAGLL